MKEKKQVLFVMLFIIVIANAQQKNADQPKQNKILPVYPKIIFSYDAEGNQTERKFEWSTTAKVASTPTKETAPTKEIEPKVLSEDVVSYHPNPVKDELLLQWELSQDHSVAAINVFDFKMQLLQSYNNNSKSNSKNISFSNYPGGVYVVVLLYSNGKQKTIKIIKQ
jgi:hypothetical protein